MHPLERKEDFHRSIFFQRDTLFHCDEFCTSNFPCFREDKINQLCSVMGVNWLYDPDIAYELTTDNVKKILAIHMRFR